MKAHDLRKKTRVELEKEKVEKAEELRQLRFDLAAGKVKNVRALRQTRKRIAQIATILGEKN
ncbi:50S ribosomal protein L29 [Patescibacteria group bacterium]|nr:50S ribosomal protein L29 [Patescibacteria group bacterium]